MLQKGTGALHCSVACLRCAVMCSGGECKVMQLFAVLCRFFVQFLQLSVVVCGYV